MNRLKTMLAAVPFLVLGLARPGFSEEVVKYHPKPADLKYTYGQHKPVMTIRPGTLIVSSTEDCFDGKVKKPGDKPSETVGLWHDNPLTGPFHIQGAERGDVLAVHIRKIEPARPHGISSYTPGFGAITGTEYTAVLEAPLPELVWWYDVDRDKGTVRFRALKGGAAVDIPMRPMIGCLGVAPARNEWRWSVTPEAYGGNMDCPEVRAGNTVYLPVNVPGALLYFGDAHLVQGDGEIVGYGVEAAVNVELKVDLIKGKPIAWPRIESDDCLMTTGMCRPLEDAFRIAAKEMVTWIAEDCGLDAMDAYQLASQVMKAEVSQMVDPNYTILVKFPKKYLPSKKPVFGGTHDRLARPGEARSAPPPGSGRGPV
ncbi:MAG TPA: acetamidase/formamidase family protein [Candidatus Aminicenantes bacterium]|nr:acetamidase/formamidase family protein [Candidatus Aminicenantes bacterium]